MTNPAQPQPQQTAKNSKCAETFVGPKCLGDQDPGPGPRTGTLDRDLHRPLRERRPLLSGGDRRRSFVWVHQTLATARQKGRAQRGHAGRRGDGWGGDVGVGDRRSPFVRHAPSAFLCWRHSFPKFPRANPAARLGVSTADTYGVVTVCLALPPPLPRPSSRKSRSEEKRALSRVFR